MTPSFCSENFDKTHPVIMEALVKANKGFVPSYGKDEETLKAIENFRQWSGTKDVDVFFCFNGTGANNFALSASTEKCHAIYCTDVSHLYVAESTAPEALTGCRLNSIKSVAGKIDLDDLQQKLDQQSTIHSPLPGLLSVSQPTEYGTVYHLDELKAISSFCKKKQLLLHIDGARIFNALQRLNCSFSELIKVAKPDVFTIGGTKCGLMFGEAVLFFSPSSFKYLKLYHKRSMQLASKNRFIAAQYNALFKKKLWLKIAKHTNKLANYFETSVNSISNDAVLCRVESNTVFVKMDNKTFKQLSKEICFYEWNKYYNETRFTFSFSNTKQEIDTFINKYKQLLKQKIK